LDRPRHRRRDRSADCRRLAVRRRRGRLRPHLRSLASWIVVGGTRGDLEPVQPKRGLQELRGYPGTVPVLDDRRPVHRYTECLGAGRCPPVGPTSLIAATAVAGAGASERLGWRRGDRSRSWDAYCRPAWAGGSAPTRARGAAGCRDTARAITRTHVLGFGGGLADPGRTAPVRQGPASGHRSDHRCAGCSRHHLYAAGQLRRDLCAASRTRPDRGLRPAATRQWDRGSMVAYQGMRGRVDSDDPGPWPCGRCRVHARWGQRGWVLARSDRDSVAWPASRCGLG
jgi:hypothetical protein